MAPIPLLTRLGRATAGLLVAAALIGLVRAADHADGNGTFAFWDLEGRRDANITNFFAFRPAPPNDGKLAMVLLLNQGIADPDYFFAEDLIVRFHIDNHSEVTLNDDPWSTTDDWMMRFGGTVTEVDKIKNDLVFEVTFEPTPDGRTAPRLKVGGLPASAEADIRVFPAGSESPVRSESAVLALEVPLALVTAANHPGLAPAETLLLWATSKVPEINGPLSDHMGMPNTSNRPANILVNRLRPRDQASFITSRPADLPADAPLAPYADVLIYHLTQTVRGFPTQRFPPPFDPFDPATIFPNGCPVDLALRADLFPYIRH